MIRESLSRRQLLAPSTLLLLAGLPAAQVQVSSFQKVSATQGSFPAASLDAGDQFGASVADLGDLDGDGVRDLLVGAVGDDDGGTGTSFFTGLGAAWVLFQNADGTVKGTQKISATAGGLTGSITLLDDFGSAAAGLGDLDGDGVVDAAVGARGDDDGASGAGAVWILFLNADGTVKAEQKLSATAGGFSGALAMGDGFGSSLANLGDVDGDGTIDLAVGAPGADDGAADAGAVWVVFLNTNGTAKGSAKISATSGGFVGTLAAGDAFGEGVGALGDLDGDLVPDLAVGASGDDELGPDRGAVYLLNLSTAGAVLSGARIGASELTGLADGDAFGSAITMSDMDGDQQADLVVGAPRSDAGGNDRGAVWVLSIDSAGTVQGASELSSTAGAFSGALDDDDLFGRALAGIGSPDGNKLEDVVVGALLDDDGASASGAAWTLFAGLAASSTVRNGSGVNPLSFAEVTPSVIGANWDTTIDIVTPGAVGSIIVIAGQPSSGVVLSGIISGELLINVPIFQFDVAAGAHSVSIPNDSGLVGTALSTQGVTFAAGDIRLTNAIDLVLGS